MKKKVLCRWWLPLIFMFVLVNSLQAADIYTEIMKLENEMRLIEIKLQKQVEPMQERNEITRREIAMLEAKNRNRIGNKLVRVRVEKEIRSLHKKVKTFDAYMNNLRKVARARVSGLEKKMMVLEKQLQRQVAQEEAQRSSLIARGKMEESRKLDKEKENIEKQRLAEEKKIERQMLAEERRIEQKSQKEAKKQEKERKKREKELEKLTGSY